jgi:hypothetical protein
MDTNDGVGRVADGIRTGQLSHGRKGCAALGSRIEAAWVLAEAGQSRGARDQCAAVCLHELEALRGAPALTARLVEALLLSGMFGQVARLLRSLAGVDLRIAPMAGNGTADAFLCGEEGSRLVVALDPAALAAADRAQVARNWSRRILDGVARRAAWPAPLSHLADAEPHRLEPGHELAAQQMRVV